MLSHMVARRLSGLAHGSRRIDARVATVRPRTFRRWRMCLFGAAAGLGSMLACAQPGWSEEIKDYGKPGSPIELVVGYQPYYTESWSGAIMRSKKFYEKYLPQGSKV